MAKQLYHLANIRKLLTQGFDDEKLRALCFDAPDFRSPQRRNQGGGLQVAVGRNQGGMFGQSRRSNQAASRVLVDGSGELGRQDSNVRGNGLDMHFVRLQQQINKTQGVSLYLQAAFLQQHGNFPQGNITDQHAVALIGLGYGRPRRFR